MSDSLPEKTANRSTSLADSPWFWVAMFGVMALVGLMAIWPKFAQRSRKLDGQAQVREQVWRHRVEGPQPEGAKPMDAVQRQSKPTAAPGEPMALLPLAILFGLLVVISIACLFAIRKTKE